VKTVLIIGGYGGFGARLSKRLSSDGWNVLVAGRSLAKAKAFCAGLAGCQPVEADRTADLGPLLEQLKPNLVIDAAGPFQDGDYGVPKACIAAGVDYLDLADARGFVCDIHPLDDAAIAAGVRVISGASSVPALSGAVIRHLIGDLIQATAVDMAISASNRATAGPSVAAAIMSYVGKPISLWRGGQWVKAIGWHKLRRDLFEVKGRRRLNRLTALSDVPDLGLIPKNTIGEPATMFRAGPEFAFQVRAIWVLSWLVVWGWLKSLSPLAKCLRFLQVPTSGLGSDRSGMLVEVKGFSGDAALIRRWTLIAEDGDGPEIPTFAAVIVAQMVVSKAVRAGAYDAGSLLALDQFQPFFDSLAIHCETTERGYLPLYHRVMGEHFNTLPTLVAGMHTIIGNGGAIGDAKVTRGRSLLAQLVCQIMGFPPDGQTSLHVNFDEHNGKEKWTRTFGDVAFSSVLRERNGQLCERFGPLSFVFDLGVHDQALHMLMRGWSAFGIPMPSWLGPSTQAREWQDGDDFRLDVSIDLPLIGRVVRYEGRLKPV
jgi:saccharopine dehydrogenase-like NADP-dependent oxidoreductase